MSVCHGWRDKAPVYGAWGWPSWAAVCSLPRNSILITVSWVCNSRGTQTEATLGEVPGPPVYKQDIHSQMIVARVFWASQVLGPVTDTFICNTRQQPLKRSYFLHFRDNITWLFHLQPQPTPHPHFLCHRLPVFSCSDEEVCSSLN